MTPIISVCIPVFNARRYIALALASVLDQDVDGLEIVVSDNASDDGTAALVEEAADPRIRLIRHRENIGAAANWSSVLDQARGRFVKLLCADDVLYPGALRAQLDAFARARPSTVLVASKRDVMDDGGTVLLRNRGLAGLDGTVPGPQAIRSVVRSGTNPLGEPLCVLLRGDVARDIGPFSDRRPYVIDLDYWCRVLARGDLYAEATTVGAFRVSPSSWSRQLALRQGVQVSSHLRALRQRHPDIIHSTDVALGTTRAWLLATGRLGVYGLTGLGRRLGRGGSTASAAGDPAEGDRQPAGNVD